MVDYRDTIRDVGFNPQTKEDYIELLRKTHGDIEDGKIKFFFIAEEEGFEVTAEDVEAITDERPTDTFQ